jgi:hypothetical protein
VGCRFISAQQRPDAQVLRLLQASHAGAEHGAPPRLLRRRRPGQVRRVEGPGRDEQVGGDGQVRRRAAHDRRDDELLGQSGQLPGGPHERARVRQHAAGGPGAGGGRRAGEGALAAQLAAGVERGLAHPEHTFQQGGLAGVDAQLRAGRVRPQRRRVHRHHRGRAAGNAPLVGLVVDSVSRIQEELRRGERVHPAGARLALQDETARRRRRLPGGLQGCAESQG